MIGKFPGTAANPNVVTDASGVGYVDPDSECTRHVWLRVRTEDGRTGALICRDCSSTLVVWHQPSDDRGRRSDG